MTATDIWPELRTGDRVISASGLLCEVRRLRNPLRITAYHEPLYRVTILKGGVCNGKEGGTEWTQDELKEAGCKLAGGVR